MMFSPRLNSLRHRWRAFVTTLVVVATLVAGSLVVIRVTARPGTPAAQAGAAGPVHAGRGRAGRGPGGEGRARGGGPGGAGRGPVGRWGARGGPAGLGRPA